MFTLTVTFTVTFRMLDTGIYVEFGVKQCPNRAESVRNEFYGHVNPYKEGLRWFAAVTSQVLAQYASILTSQ